MNETEIVGRLWSRHRQWSIAADRLKARIVFWRTMALVSSATGAALQTLSAAVSGSGLAKVAGAAGAVALVAVPFIARAFLGAEQVRQWLRARSVSEGLKSEIYRFRAHASPYAESDRVTTLIENGRALEVWVDALAVELASVEPDTKPAPGPLDAEAYVSRRVKAQIDSYYRPRARSNARGAARFRSLELVTAGAAALLGALVSALQLSSESGGGMGAWVAVLTTIGGGLAAHAAAHRYDQQARMYFATARQLEDLRDGWVARGKATDAGTWDAFVNGCEEAISAENRGWMAKLDPEEKPSAG